MNLIVFPFAGGSSFSFNFFKDNKKSLILDYPGRGKKSHQDLITSVDGIVKSLMTDLPGKLNVPYIFYGHSMGTLVSYMVIKELQRKNLPLPQHLFVSGRGGPSHPVGEIRYNLPREKFWQVIKELGGCPDEILMDVELMNFFEPILRADFQALETYVYAESKPFDIPVTVLLGESDNVTHDEAQLWQKETTQPIEIMYFEGDHFFIYNHSEKIAGMIDSKSKIKI